MACIAFYIHSKNTWYVRGSSMAKATTEADMKSPVT